MKVTVVTTFNEKGLTTYAQRMIDSFNQNWPKEVTLQLYPENCKPNIDHVDNAVLFNLTNVVELMAFKDKWKNIPMATGWCEDSPKHTLIKHNALDLNGMQFASLTRFIVYATVPIVQNLIY